MNQVVFDPGSVHVGLRWQDGRARDISIRVVRPTMAAALRGRQADEAVRLLPLLYAICGVAQGVAARLALAAARGQAHEATVDAGVLAEAQREHLWRLLLDWPPALGLARQQALFVEGRRRLEDGSFAAWTPAALREHLALVEQGVRGLDTAVAIEDPQLPLLGAAETVDLWPRLAAGFAATPEYRGAAASTGAQARHAEAACGALAGRVMARIADLTEPAGLGRASAATVAPGIGRAAVETARGLLLHEVVLDGERVADYVIVAPTEWNFHPAGALKALLASLVTAKAADCRAGAARVVLAFDPCVRCELAVADDAAA